MAPGRDSTEETPTSPNWDSPGPADQNDAARNNGAHRNKRRRTAIACTVCRARKSRVSCLPYKMTLPDGVVQWGPPDLRVVRGLWV